MNDLLAAYSTPGSYTNPMTTVTLGDPGYDTSGTDDTAVFQQAIDEVNAGGGGIINVPAGSYQLASVLLKSDVHFKINGGATLTLAAEGNMFNVSGGIQNVSFKGISGRFDVVLPDFGKGREAKVRFIGATSVENMLVQNVDINDDQQTTFSCIELTWDESLDQRPNNVTIKNVTTSDGHYGYGVVQSQAASNVLFTNLYGKGGIVVRLETGAKNMNIKQAQAQQNGQSLNVGVDNIKITNSTVESGQAAIMTGPHAITTNGDVFANYVTAVSSICAVKTANGGTWKYTQQQIDDNDMVAGTFEKLSAGNVDATYTSGCIPAKYSYMSFYPQSELQTKVFDDPSIPEGYSAPSLTVIMDAATYSQPTSTWNVTGNGAFVNPLILTTSFGHFAWQIDSWTQDGSDPSCP
ncbi:MAG: hypothetical protein AAF571_09690 [Verrucomicrobiota bacterium]